MTPTRRATPRSAHAGERFDTAILGFVVAYGKQTELDYQQLLASHT